MNTFERTRRIARLNVALKGCGFQPAVHIHKFLVSACYRHYYELANTTGIDDEYVDLMINGIIIALIRRSAFFLTNGRTGEFNELCTVSVKRGRVMNSNP